MRAFTPLQGDPALYGQAGGQKMFADLKPAFSATLPTYTDGGVKAAPAAPGAFDIASGASTAYTGGKFAYDAATLGPKAAFENLVSPITGAANLAKGAAGGHLSTAFSTSPGAAWNASGLASQFGTPGAVPAGAELAGFSLPAGVGAAAVPASSAASAAGAGFGTAAGGEFAAAGAGASGAAPGIAAMGPYAAAIAAAYGLYKMSKGKPSVGPNMSITTKGAGADNGVWEYEKDAMSNYAKSLGLADDENLVWYGGGEKAPQAGWSLNGGPAFSSPEEAMGRGAPGGWKDAMREAALKANPLGERTPEGLFQNQADEMLYNQSTPRLQGTAARFGIEGLYDAAQGAGP